MVKVCERAAETVAGSMIGTHGSASSNWPLKVGKGCAASFYHIHIDIKAFHPFQGCRSSS